MWRAMALAACVVTAGDVMQAVAQEGVTDGALPKKFDEAVNLLAGEFGGSLSIDRCDNDGLHGAVLCHTKPMIMGKARIVYVLGGKPGGDLRSIGLKIRWDDAPKPSDATALDRPLALVWAIGAGEKAAADRLGELAMADMMGSRDAPKPDGLNLLVDFGRGRLDAFVFARSYIK